MSGGERRRTALAALLVTDIDLLMLDEPTNHLDIETIDWLAGILASRRGALVTVTHDRWFLDAVCTLTWEVDERLDRAVRRRLRGLRVGARRTRTRWRRSPKTAGRTCCARSWRGCDAGRRPAPRSRSFRIDAANALIADEPPARDRTQLATFSSARLGKSVFDVEDATLALGGATLLDDVTWRVGPGDRIGLVGVNGSGKTTLLRVLAGLRSLDTGTRQDGHDGAHRLSVARRRRTRPDSARARGGRVGAPSHGTGRWPGADGVRVA